jgi:phosphatidylglycerophosphatase A
MSFIQKIAIHSATSLGIGYAPKAPGTFGSLPGLLVGVGLFHSQAWGGILAPAVLSIILIGYSYWCIDVTEKVWSTHDDQRIVIDEVAGQAIALAYINPSITNLVLGFVLFRALDITKPALIGHIDQKWPGALGTLFDDVLAGLVALLILVGINSFWTL